MAKLPNFFEYLNQILQFITERELQNDNPKRINGNEKRPYGYKQKIG